MRAWRRSFLWAIALYVGLVLVLTWPLATHLTTHVPGDGIDDPSLAWNLWWIKARLVDQRNFDLFHVGWMFHPIDINLAFYTLTPLNGLLSIPLQTGATLIVASNLLLLSSFVLSAVGAFLLAQQELAFAFAPTNGQGDRSQNLYAAALLAGAIYAYASSKFFYAALGQFNIASSQWIPFCVLFVLRLARSKSYRQATRNGLLAGLFLTLQAWAELTYASFLLLFIALAFFWALFIALPGQKEKRWRTILLTVTPFALVGLVFGIGIAPFLWAMLPDMRTEGDFFTSGGGFADIYSADLLGYLLPTQHHPWLGGIVDRFAFPHDKGQQIYIGYSAVVLALIGGWRWVRQSPARQWGLFWLVNAGFFWWLTLGAQLRWNGHPLPLPGPFALISQLPFFSGNRYPSRYSVMVMLIVAILAAAGLYHLQIRLAQSRVSLSSYSLSRVSLSPVSLAPITPALFVILLFLTEHLSLPLPLSDFRTPTIYERLAAEPGDFTLLEIPTGWRNGARVMGKSDILIMMQQWYQTTHGKQRLGGNTSRNPLYKFQYFTDAPLLGDLIALMNSTPSDDPNQNELPRVLEASIDELIARNRPLAPHVLDLLDVRFLTVHVEKTPPLLQRFIAETLPVTLVDQWHGIDWSGAPATIDLYKVNLPPAQDEWSIDLADESSSLYLAEGWATKPWQGVRYAIRPCATLLLDLPTAEGELRITLSDGATISRAMLNGATILPQPTDEPTTFVMAIGLNQGSAPVDRFTLCTDQATPLNLLDTPPTTGWPVGATGLSTSDNIFVRSAGNDVGNFASILRDGRPVMATTRGYNLAAFDSAGTLITTATFDTLQSADESVAMIAWIEELPMGTMVAGAVMDEASYALTAEAVQALATLGVSTDLRGRFRWSHAFIGIKGAPPGTALEQSTLLQPATITVGVAVDAPVAYLGLRTVNFAK